MAFRSIVIALKAAITTLISATVGFGVLTLVFKMGHGLSLIGLDRTGPIESFVPPIAFAILFGLSMDYEVFLMSRIREEHIHGKDTKHAVSDGVAAIGRVVFAAAIIMSAVFIAFMLTPDRVSKEFGLLLAVAILTDALIMRLTVVPSLLSAARREVVVHARAGSTRSCPTSRSSRRPSSAADVARSAAPGRGRRPRRNAAPGVARPARGPRRFRQYSSRSTRQSPAPRKATSQATTAANAAASEMCWLAVELRRDVAWRRAAGRTRTSR